MRPGRSLFALLLVLLNAGAVLLFRATITLDGPMHVLHASVLLDDRDHGQGIAYDASKLDLQLGDLLLMPLVRTLDPFRPHAALLALVLALLWLGVWCLSRALGVDPLGGVLLTLPVLWGWPLVLGFLHFLIGVATCLFAWAWWIRRDRIGLPELAALVGWVLLAAFTHRAAPLLLALVLPAQEGLLRLRDPGSWGARWAHLPRWLPAVLALLLVAGASWLVTMALVGEPAEPAEPRRPIMDLLGLRPLVLFDQVKESGFRLAFGCLLLAGSGAVLLLRRRVGTYVPTGVTLLLVAGVLVLVSLVLRGENADLHYVSERTQWCALLLVALWAGSGLKGRWPLFIGIPMLVLHVERTRHTEAYMAGYLPHQQRLQDQAGELTPGSTVVPVNCWNNWLYLHQSAFLAALHDGVVWTPIDHLRFRFPSPPDAAMTDYAFKRAKDWGWLEEHLQAGRRPPVDHILLVGEEAGHCTARTQGMGTACSRIGIEN